VKALKNAGQSSSSRSLSSELSSVGELSNIRDDFDADPAVDVSASRDSSHDIQNGGAAGKDGLSSQLTNAETSRTALQAKYEKLEEEHLDALDLVEELKAEIVRQKLSAPLSPTSPVIRRKSSQNVMSIDRAHRSLASLGNLATENFEDRPDVKQNFELNLAAVMHELHQRSERVEVLEAELAGVKKEMENKMTIISGLTRERTTMKSSSPVDMSVISSIRDQMVQSEVRLKTLHQDAAAREMEMAKEIEMLKRTVPPVPAREPEANKEQHAQERELQEQKLRGLQADLLEWQAKHKAAVDSIQTSEQRMLSTVTELEASLNQVQRLYDVKSAELATQANSMAAATVAFELECSKHAATVESLNREIDDHKSTVDSHVGKILELQQAHDTARREMEEGRRFKQTALKDLNAHRDQIEDLGQQLQEYRSSLEFHQHSIKSLRDSHAQELEDMHGAVMKEAEADAAARFDELSSQHEREIAKHQDIMRGLELQLQDHEATIDAHRRELGAREQRVRELEQQIQRTGASNGKEESAMKETMMNLKMAEDARATAEASLILSQAKIEELTWAKTELNEELDDLREKEGRARRLVDDLEGQLHSTFETSQAATSRLSLMQTTRDSELQEARAAHHKAQEEIVALNGRVEQLEVSDQIVQWRSNSQQPQSQRSSTMLHPSPTPDSQPNGSERTASMSSIRKSGSVQSLPSPPPAIPLPPLPGLASPNPSNSSHRPTSPAKDASLQRIEEQEARIKTIEKHLFAEKQLTATLEEALVDLETQGNKVKNEVEAWKKKAWAYEDELGVLKKERNLNRHSLQAVEEERSARKEAEAARAHLEERMAALNKKKKKSTLNCF
jgi:kinesin family protein 4/21/27